MTEKETKVDALLAATCSRLLNAGDLVNQMRVSHRNQEEIAYWQHAVALGEHLAVAGHAITEAHRILLAGKGILPKEEEWIQ